MVVRARRSRDLVLKKGDVVGKKGRQDWQRDAYQTASYLENSGGKSISRRGKQRHSR